MVIIVGLGNPGSRYDDTRHNAGFMVIDNLAKKLNVKMDKNAFQGIIGTGKIDNEKVILAKPQTYMNLSGECVSEILKFYKVPLENLIVVYDDIDIKLGKIKIRPSGSAGTHNGMRNIISLINSENFVRVRVGTDKPQQGIDLADYVLMKLKTEEKTIMDEATENASKAIIEIVKNGCQKAMNLYN